ncbi:MULTISPECIES: hypothetical protein [Actinomadura]|uniref:Mce-associated membrane protein n=1 Tax=Actinomadura yumaensis TaxID=111807 RepID=A0ABW2CJL2_9ACTN|nr:hypothetical protein [Actinomadura sp. J1-007]
MRGLLKPFAIALALLLAGVAVMAVRSGGGEEEPSDRSALDGVATNLVTGDVSSALTQVFTYTATDTATAERAAAEKLTGSAAAQYRTVFGQVKRQAPAQRVALSTRVVRAGVTSLTGDTARLLVFLDQTTTRAGAAAPAPAAAQLAVTATRRDGHWLISDIRSR